MNFRILLDKISRSPGKVILFFGLVAIFLPWLLTQKIFGLFSFMETGQIGDTIGGITAPIIGMLNALLLYITLKRQDEQISIQKADTDFDRKIDLIRSSIEMLIIDFDLDDSAKKQEFDYKGMYKGLSAVTIVGSMFDLETNILRYFKISVIGWVEFMSLANKILFEALWILEKNQTSKRTEEEKAYVYSYTMALIGGIVDLFQKMNTFYRQYPTDPGIAKFKLETFESIFTIVDKISIYDPLNDLRH